MAVYRIVAGELQEIELVEGSYILFNGDCYLIDTGPLGPIWVWIGHRSSVDERFVASYQANKLRLKRGEIPSVISVSEGEEPPEFQEHLRSFVVVEGGTHGFLKRQPSAASIVSAVGTHLPALYRVEGDTLVELPLSKKSLSSSSIIILDVGLIIWVWIGHKASVPESFYPAKMITERDSQHPDPELRWVFEGDEDPRFFDYFRLWEEDVNEDSIENH
ncbi:MAG: hypothetical protein ACFFGZ_11610 [Candidatus Thorarchaeota archaeon]